MEEYMDTKYIVQVTRNDAAWMSLPFASLNAATNCFEFHKSHICDSNDKVRIELKEDSKLLKFVQSSTRSI